MPHPILMVEGTIISEVKDSSSGVLEEVVMAEANISADIGFNPEGREEKILEVTSLPVGIDSFQTIDTPSIREAPAGYAPKLPSGTQPPAFILPPSEKLHLDSDHPHMLIISLRNSGDKKKDVLLMRCIHGILVSSPGHDRFAFQIFEGNHFYRLEFPNETTGLNQTIIEKIQTMLGTENIRLESIILH